MANNKSARKRIVTNKRIRLQNRYYKTSVRTLTKLFLKTLEDQTPGSKEKLQTILNSIYSFLDKGTKKNVFHKNTAARHKARLASRRSTIS